MAPGSPLQYQDYSRGAGDLGAMMGGAYAGTYLGGTYWAGPTWTAGTSCCPRSATTARIWAGGECSLLGMEMLGDAGGDDDCSQMTLAPIIMNEYSCFS